MTMRITHDALAVAVDQWRTPIRNSGRVYSDEVEHCLDMSVRHLTAASLGERLYTAYRDDRGQLSTVLSGIDHSAAVTGAEWMVYGGATATLDLCATATSYWCGEIGDRTDHLSDMIDGSGRARNLDGLDSWAGNWVEATYHHPSWDTLVERRTLQALHALDTRSTTPTDTNLTVREQPTAITTSDIFASTLGFAQWRWRAFWTALAAHA
jgi:hypothetical protein